MYIQTDNAGNIIQAISVGGMPTENGYEINSIDDEILSDIFNYKYIDGEFVKKETDIRQENIDTIKKIKINHMSEICEEQITQGIDYNGQHYSLSDHDQLNLTTYSISAALNPSDTFLYHADGEDCREYTATEITDITTLAKIWKTYHLTYFNAIKQYINAMTNVDDIIAISYGDSIDDEHETKLTAIIQSGGSLAANLPRNIINDNFNYEALFPSIDINNFIISNKEEENVDEIVESDEPIVSGTSEDVTPDPEYTALNTEEETIVESVVDDNDGDVDEEDTAES